jgi:helix-hairpin-helix protein
MEAAQKELQQLKGVGEILSLRLIEEGLDSFAKIAEAGSVGLSKVKGINPRMVESIVEQARRLAATAAVDKEAQVNDLRQAISKLRDSVQTIAATARDRFQDELAGKTGRKLAKHLIRVCESLERIDQKLPKRSKRVGKGLVKAEQRLTGLGEASVASLCKGMKKTRKTLKKVLK